MIKRQYQMKSEVYRPKHPAVRRHGWMRITPKIWGRRVTETGVMQCELYVNGYSVFVLRIARNREHRYFFTAISATNYWRTGVTCPTFTHEAKAFNEGIGEIVGVNFKAPRG